MIKQLTINGVSVKVDPQTKWISLTDLWKASGAGKTKKPKQWLRWKGAESLLQSLADNLKVGFHTLYEVRPGRNGGTWAHYKVGVHYAQWISSDFAIHVTNAFEAWNEEEENPTLKMERAYRKYKRLGFTDHEIEQRFRGIAARNKFTSVLAASDCDAYAKATDEINKAVLGCTAREIKSQRGLKSYKPARDALSARELRWVRFVEEEARDEILERGAKGNQECLIIITEVASRVGNAINGKVA